MEGGSEWPLQVSTRWNCGYSVPPMRKAGCRRRGSAGSGAHGPCKLEQAWARPREEPADLLFMQRVRGD